MGGVGYLKASFEKHLRYRITSSYLHKVMSQRASAALIEFDVQLNRFVNLCEYFSDIWDG